MLNQSQKGRATSSEQDVSRENGLKTALGPGVPASTNIAPSLISEFTKRRNWSQRILEDLKDFLHILSPEGRIQYVSQGTFEVTGYKAEELQDRFIVDFIHPDDSALYIREFNESIASGNALRFFHRFRKADGSYAIFESHGHPHLTSEAASFAGAGVARFCRGFFMLSRPYPTKNALLLDSFLEHKIENERLKKRIADLKREEREETENMQQQRLNKSDRNATPSDVRTMSDGPTTNSLSPSSYQSSGMMPPPPPKTMDTALTQQNLNEALASSKPDSIKDKMARYEGGTHVESIEMFTGLRYREGERSLGISTGGSSPALIRGDVGIAIPADKDSRNDKRKRLKLADEYVCTICATLDSPEWRKGPAGPKTLCNACGLRWAKQEKKLNP